MKPIFLNESLDRDFETKGYVQIPVLNAAEIARLSHLFNKHNLQYNQPFHTTHFSTDLNYKKEVNDLITDIVFPKLTSLLNNYKAIFGNFMIKSGNSDFAMPVHADWTYVNEEQFRSLAIWIPLVDTDENNGCFGVIEGSHKIIGKIRGPRIQLSTGANNVSWIQRVGKLLPAKAGEAIIYDHALLHYSLPNKSSLPRPALNLSAVPRAAEIIHYCIPEGAPDIEVYKVIDTNFYINYNNFQRPETNSLTAVLPASSIKMIDEDMNLFSKEGKRKSNFLSRLFGV